MQRVTAVQQHMSAAASLPLSLHVCQSQVSLHENMRTCTVQLLGQILDQCMQLAVVKGLAAQATLDDVHFWGEVVQRHLFNKRDVAFTH